MNFERYGRAMSPGPSVVGRAQPRQAVAQRNVKLQCVRANTAFTDLALDVAGALLFSTANRFSYAPTHRAALDAVQVTARPRTLHLLVTACACQLHSSPHSFALLVLTKKIL